MKLYLVGRRIDDKAWEVFGIFNSEEKAISICVDCTYFIGPLNLNEVFPVETVIWPGCYYPIKRIENE